MTGCALFRCDGDQEALSVYALGYAIVLRSNSSRGNEMTTQSSHPILVTGAAGAVGSIGRNVTEMLLAKGHKVRALVRREDERAEALRQLGAEVMQGDLTDRPQPNFVPVMPSTAQHPQKRRVAVHIDPGIFRNRWVAVRRRDFVHAKLLLGRARAARRASHATE
jgi:NAD(P)-dependent dehydrogenase (short-subunit alcohol dehydrogenase family)